MAEMYEESTNFIHTFVAQDLAKGGQFEGMTVTHAFSSGT